MQKEQLLQQHWRTQGLLARESRGAGNAAQEQREAGQWGAVGAHRQQGSSRSGTVTSRDLLLLAALNTL